MSTRPNLVLVTLDQFRADCLSAAGHPVVQTPRLDELAGSVVRFARHDSQAAPCGPGRASLYTGTYQMNHGSSATAARSTRGSTIWRRRRGWRAASRHGEMLGDHGPEETLGYWQQSSAIPCIIRDPLHPATTVRSSSGSRRTST